MKYRGIEYAVIQEVDRGSWRWTVNLIDGTAESGLRKTREGALTAVVLTIDRWIARSNLREMVRDAAFNRMPRRSDSRPHRTIRQGRRNPSSGMTRKKLSGIPQGSDSSIAAPVTDRLRI
jgi:hypothetical protein